MPQLLLLGLDPRGVTPVSESALAHLNRSVSLLACNPRHFAIKKQCGDRVSPANATKAHSLLERGEDFAYVAIGSPHVDDAYARELHRHATTAGWDVQVVAEQSLLEQAYASLALGGDPHVVVSGTASLATADAAVLVLAANATPRAMQVFRRRYPITHEVGVLAFTDKPAPEVRTLLLGEALTQHSDVLYIPPLTPLEQLDEPTSLRWIMARLRAPDGCPWDQEQTHRTLKKHLLEETAEVLDALDEDDMDALREELGDLLLQVYFQAQIAEEQGDFTFDDVVRGISEKLVRRHPHVFGDRAVGSAEQALAKWESIKQAEHARQGKERQSLLDGVPLALSGLATAQAIGKAVVKVGFDWPDLHGVMTKLREEMAELDAAETTEERFEELGDVLFVMAQVAKWLEVDAEEALRASNAKFRRRFAYMEEVARSAGSELGDYSFEKLDSLWEEAKLATSNPWGCPR